jgi:iron complex outermembrane receptor protein
VSTFTFTSAPAAWDTHFRSYAGFGQATLKLTDSFHLIGGARYTDNEVYYNYSRTQIGPAAPGISATFAAAERADDSGWSGRAGFEWQATDDVMTYATYSRGYKGSALNVFYSMNQNSLGKISPETSDTYELGLKAQFLDPHLTLNLAGFWEDFDNFQANSFTTLANGTVLVSLNNAGSVRSRGVELELTYEAAPGLNFRGGYTYDDATITDFRCAASLTGANLATCLAHNGKPLPFAPRNKFNIAGNWTLPFSNKLPFDVRLSSRYDYTSRTNFDIDQTPLARQAAYGLLDASLSFSAKDNHYDVTLLGKNLTDKFYTSFVTPVGNGVAAGSFARLQVPRDAERYLGIQVSVRY